MITKYKDGTLSLEMKLHMFVIITIMIAEICFYTIDAIRLYSLLTMIGMGISFLLGLRYLTSKVRLDNFILWSSVVYAMYFFYGIFFLRYGVFSISSIGYRFLEGIALFISIAYIVRENYFYLVKPFVIAGLFSIAYLIYLEGSQILSGGVRIGETLSGNVNTAGYNFGLIGMLIIWQYAIRKNKKDLVLYILFTSFMLLTGSKKTLIILLFDVFILYWYNRHRTTTWLKVILSVACVLYLIFNIPYFYSTIGIRLHQMFSTMFLESSGIDGYSYSTDMRERMIVEAWNFFLENPIFGGGWNYFAAKTALGYEYSHSNFVEMLSSFGLIGTLIYYSKHFYNLLVSFNVLIKRKARGGEMDFAILSLALMVSCLIIDWAAVTFSAQIVWYLPVIISSVMVDAILRNKG